MNDNSRTPQRIVLKLLPSVPPFLFEEPYYFVPSRVGERKLLPYPHLFIRFLLFCGFLDLVKVYVILWIFGLSEQKLFFCLSVFQMIGQERLNKWYWHFTSYPLYLYEEF